MKNNIFGKCKKIKIYQLKVANPLKSTESLNLQNNLSARIKNLVKTNKGSFE